MKRAATLANFKLGACVLGGCLAITAAADPGERVTASDLDRFSTGEFSFRKYRRPPECVHARGASGR